MHRKMVGGSLRHGEKEVKKKQSRESGGTHGNSSQWGTREEDQKKRARKGSKKNKKRGKRKRGNVRDEKKNGEPRSRGVQVT